MKCPKCRYGMVYRYNDILKCGRCDYTEITAGDAVRPKNKKTQEYARGS